MDMEHSTRQAPLFHGLDPRVLLITAAGAAFGFSLIRSTSLSCVCLVFALSFVAAARPAMLPLLKRLALANFFIAFLWLTVPLTMPGEPLFNLGPIHASREGVDLALRVTIKSNAILLSFLAFVSGISLPLIGCSLERLRIPPKLAFLFLFTCSHIHVIGDEWRRLQTAARLRGFIPRNSLHTYRTIGNMLGLTFINSIDRSRRIHEAMLLRGFRGRFHTVTQLKAGHGDIVFLALFFSTLAGLLCLDLHI